MKKIFLLLVSFVIFSQLISLEFTEIGNSFQVLGSFELEQIETIQSDDETFNRIIISDCRSSMVSNQLELPIYSKLVSLPNTGNFKCSQLEYDYDEILLSHKIATVEPNIQSNISEVDDWFPNNIVTISDPNIMRGNRFTQISISPIQYNPKLNLVRIIKDVQFEFEIDQSDQKNPLTKRVTSSSFDKIATEKILGSKNHTRSIGGEYLFIAPSSVENILQPLLRWKEKLGFRTKLAFLEDIGTTAEDVKAYLQNAYDNWELPPEFVVLVGDVSGAISCPSFYVEGYFTPWDVSDHNYTLLEGEDYFPDIFIGRLSVQSQIELMTIVSKIINYERNPFIEIPWQKRALMVGFVDNWNGYSQRETLMEIRNKLLDFEYTVVDTFINPWQQGQTMLANSISEGESFVCYRGAGSHTMWSGSPSFMFNIDNINLLTNGFMLPIVTSMTCGGGDFANEQVSTCFGEKWLASGSPGNPQGAIGFIGPSEWDTKTTFNNANAAGIYQGITQEGLFRCGEMLLRGKIELYNNFPNNHAWGGALDSDQFYFYVYNLLGDPGLQIQTDIPQEIELAYDELISSSANFLEVQVNCFEGNLSDFTIAITSEDSLISTGKTNVDGTAIIPIDLPTGDYEVTASKYCYIPITGNLEVYSDAALNLNFFSFSNALVSGDNSNLEFVLENEGTEDIENLSISPICENQNITMQTNPILIDVIEAGQEQSGQFEIMISDLWNNSDEIYIFLEISSDNGTFEFLIPAEIVSPELVISDFQVQNSSQCLIQNQTTDVLIELQNCGNSNTYEFQAELVCTNGKAEIEESSATFANIVQDETGTGIFVITPNDVNSGEIAQFELGITSSDTLLQNISFSFPIGIVDSTSVSFSENGYFAIESNDDGNFNAPEYDWIEIDPTYGGDGSLLGADHTTIDGYTKVIPLPFQFNYYGTFYDQISVCSEGYISLDPTPLVFHRNRNIPSGVGPAGMIAPFWDNLYDGRIYVKYDEDNNYFIIEWSDFKNEFDESNEVFQVILYDPEFYFTINSNKLIKFQYKEVSNTDQDNNYATVGLENYQQTEGLILTFSNIYPTTVHELQNETAILFCFNTDSTIPFISTTPENYEFTLSDETPFSIDFTLSNELGTTDVSYDISLAHFAQIPSGEVIDPDIDPSRSIETNFILNMTPEYIPIEPMDFHFYLVHPDVDGENIQGIMINFPPGFYVNSSGDIDVLQYNNETGDGAEISWGYETGITLPPSSIGVHIYVNVTVDENQVSPIDINWQIEGDGSGASPHQVDGSFIVEPTGDNYFWVTYPNGGETIIPTMQDTLRWEKYGEAEYVQLLLSRDNGVTLETIDDMAENSGIYPHIFDGPLSDNCWFAISTLDGQNYDMSDDSFSISAFDILEPEEGSVLSFGETDTLSWQFFGNYETVKIEISTNNGYSWDVVCESATNTGSYEYVVPGPPSEYCFFRLSNDTGLVQNVSSVFTIVDSPVDWLSVDHTYGVIPAGGSDNNVFTIFPAGLEPATYFAVIRVITDIGQILNIPIIIILPVSATVPPIQKFQLGQNYPNPFNPFTKIDFEVPTASKVNIKVFNIKGQFVKTLMNDYKLPGNYYTYWDGTDLYNRKVSSGIYFYKLSADKITKTKKMILIK